VAGEHARRLHQAKLEALQIIGQARNRLVEEALAETRRRLIARRAGPNYPLVLRLLVVEAIRALGLHLSPVDNYTNGKGDSDQGPPVLEADPRDEALLRRILNDLSLNWPITPSLDCWGGVVARSGDGRVVVMNTLEARLERAVPFLRRDLAALFEKAAHAGQSKVSRPPTNEILGYSLAGSE
jgi:V/A-type H+/Na+-transporting ATPase subunit E